MAHDETAERPLRSDAQRNRGAVLEAAREVFSEQGLDVSFHEVARRAAVGVGTVYRRFPDRDTLIDAIFEEQVRDLAEAAERAAEAADAWAALRELLEHLCASLAGDRGLRDLVLGPGPRRQRATEVRERMTPAVTQLLERAKAEGSLRPDARLLDVPYIVLATDAVALASPGSDAWRRYLAIALDGLGTAGSRLPADESGMDAVDDAFSTWGAYRP